MDKRISFYKSIFLPQISQKNALPSSSQPIAKNIHQSKSTTVNKNIEQNIEKTTKPNFRQMHFIVKGQSCGSCGGAR